MSTERTEYRIIALAKPRPGVNNPTYEYQLPFCYRDDQPDWAERLASFEIHLNRVGMPYRVEYRTVIELLGEWQPRVAHDPNESQGRIQDGHAADDWANRER